MRFIDTTTSLGSHPSPVALGTHEISWLREAILPKIMQRKKLIEFETLISSSLHLSRMIWTPVQSSEGTDRWKAKI